MWILSVLACINGTEIVDKWLISQIWNIWHLKFQCLYFIPIAVPFKAILLSSSATYVKVNFSLWSSPLLLEAVAHDGSSCVVLKWANLSFGQQHIHISPSESGQLPPLVLGCSHFILSHILVHVQTIQQADMQNRGTKNRIDTLDLVQTTG